MCWVAIERAMRMATRRGLPADLVRWGRSRDAIYRQIMSRGWSAEVGAFVQQLDGDVLDASVLMMPLVKFVSPVDPKWLATLDTLGANLVTDSLVHRYDVGASPDGLLGTEGTFSICSFWYIEALTRAGRLEDARLAFEKCSPTPTISACTQRRSDRRENNSATSRRPSPTFPSSVLRSTSTVRSAEPRSGVLGVQRSFGRRGGVRAGFR